MELNFPGGIIKAVQLDPALVRLGEIFRTGGHTLYAVGGMPRNILLNLPVNDIDICSPLPIDKAEALLKTNGVPTKRKGAAFGTLDICLGGTTFEYACFRKENYNGTGKHQPSFVSFNATLQDDAFRRDFTANALYLDVSSGTVSDPTGGMEDIEKKLLRATSKDPNVIMSDDGLRILRLARFAAQLNFAVESATMQAAYNNRFGLADISAERIYAELCKILTVDTSPYKGNESSILRGLRGLMACGAIDVILPELKECENITQRPDYHKYNVMEHCIRSCACSKGDIALRFAALLHDVGKAAAFKAEGTMHGHELYGADMAEKILARLRAPKAVRQTAAQLIRYHMYDLNGAAGTAKLKRLFVKLGVDMSRQLIALREADVHGSGIEKGVVKTAKRWQDILDDMQKSGTPFSESQLDCTGEDICRWLNIPPCPRIGEVKHALLMHCAVKPKDNNREKLRLITKDIGKGNTL